MKVRILLFTVVQAVIVNQSTEHYITERFLPLSKNIMDIWIIMKSAFLAAAEGTQSDILIPVSMVTWLIPENVLLKKS